MDQANADVMTKAAALMRELVDSLALLRWQKLDPRTPRAKARAALSNEEDAVAYQGIGAGFTVTLMSWRIDLKLGGQMARAYDGACMKGSMMVKLERDVARKVFLYAEDMLKP